MSLLIALMVLGVVVVVDAAQMPPAFLEPLGSRAFPFWLGVALVVLSAIRLVRLARARRPATPSDTSLLPDALPGLGGVPGLLVATALTGFYVLAIQYHVLGYAISTAIYLFALMFIFSRPSIAGSFLAALGSLAVGFLIRFIFTRILFIDIASLLEPLRALA